MAAGVPMKLEVIVPSAKRLVSFAHDGDVLFGQPEVFASADYTKGRGETNGNRSLSKDASPRVIHE